MISSIHKDAMERARELVPRFLDAVLAAGERRTAPAKLHVLAGSEGHVPAEWFERRGSSRLSQGRSDVFLAQKPRPQSASTFGLSRNFLRP